MVGLATVPAGIGWFVVSFTDSDWNEILTGGVWKGPLLAIAGAGALVVGIRSLKVGDVEYADEESNVACLAAFV